MLALTIEYAYYGEPIVIYPAVLQEDQQLILVDCCAPGFLPHIRTALDEAGMSLDHITGVVITHHDYDHVGSLGEILRKHPAVKVYASEAQAPYIAKEKRSLRLAQLEEMMQTASEDLQQEMERMRFLFSDVEPGRVDVVVEEGELLPWCGGAQVIATDGHMPGHISLYLPAHKTLIAGDALTGQNGRLALPSTQYTLDMPKAIQSVEKLLQYDIQRVICYNGGVFEGDIPGQIKALVAQAKAQLAL